MIKILPKPIRQAWARHHRRLLLKWQLSHLYPFAGIGVPLFLTKSGQLALADKQGPSKHRTFVVSMPKSGTYLVSALLEQFGLVSCGVHMSEHDLADFRGRTIPEMIHQYRDFGSPVPIKLSAKLILPGQFSVGHLGYFDRNRKALKGVKLLMLKRECRSSLVSMMRWYMNPGRGDEHGEEWKTISDQRARMAEWLRLYAQWAIVVYKNVALWSDDPNVLQVAFEVLQGDDGPFRQQKLVKSIANHVGTSIKDESCKICLQNVLGRQTKTWSGRRTDLSDYWSPESEAIFASVGGPELNARLGYQNTAPFLKNEGLSSESNL